MGPIELLTVFSQPLRRAAAKLFLPPPSSRANYAKAARKLMADAKGKAHGDGEGLLSYTPEQERDVSSLPIDSRYRTRLQDADGMLTRRPDDLGILHPGRYHIDAWGRFVATDVGTTDMTTAGNGSAGAI